VDERKEKDGLLPPNTSHIVGSEISNRASIVSSSGSSFVSLADSKYPVGAIPSVRGLIPYAYDPSGDENEPMDFVTRPLRRTKLAKSKGGSTIPPGKRHSHSFPWRGIANVSVLVSLILGLLCLIIVYPVMRLYRDEKGNNAI
jgi:hypothetical protein